MNYIPEDTSAFKMIKKRDVWFTVVMLRGFIELYEINHSRIYLNPFNRGLDYAWEHVRDKRGLFNADFTGGSQDNRKWLLAQAAAVEMYARLATIK